MANIFVYLQWRADIPMAVDGFNEADNLVLSMLAYSDLGGIVSRFGAPTPLPEVRSAFFELHSREEIEKSTVITAKAPFLMDEMCTGARFEGMRIGYYLDEIDRENNAQIAAMTFFLPDDTVYVAFRGTDNTLIGWKEDFDLSYASGTPGQLRAAEYLNEIGATVPGRLRIGGHSKGGNFAILASAFCASTVREKIDVVYTNDGPGFMEEITDSPEYRRILPRIVSIIPDTSVIGLLFANDCPHKVVKSSANGLYQHDGFSWEILRNRFVPAELTELGRFIDKSLDGWLDTLDAEDRKSFTDTVFELFRSTGMETLSAMSGQKLKSLEAILTTMRDLPKDKQRELRRLALQLLQSGGQTAKEQLPKRTAPKQQKARET
ncbi:MAG: DUF2974 domain-containing protein [Clostridia bacterium]|nr:DUF2974 domain-containing protein [Clostridia bacterium]